MSQFVRSDDGIWAIQRGHVGGVPGSFRDRSGMVPGSFGPVVDQMLRQLADDRTREPQWDGTLRQLKGFGF